jgi:hypothetical protein
MSISKNRMFPKSKSKQQLLTNLEKLKKFKPLIKQSIDTFEKPRKSLHQQKIELPEFDVRNKRKTVGHQEGDFGVITEEEGTSNYNTRNSFDDFREIEKNIRKSVRIENLKGIGKKGHKKRKNKVLNDEKYVGRKVCFF